jgi:4'-phosphopantetheinyl transferase superfamily protein
MRFQKMLSSDLEIIEPRSDAFAADYFTAEEQALVAQACAPDRLRLLALIWSGKESALKALREGLRLDTRCVIVTPVDALRRGAEDPEAHLEAPVLSFQPLCSPDTWRPMHVRYAGGQIFHGWWQHSGNLLRTLVAAPPTPPPILLETCPGWEPTLQRESGHPNTFFFQDPCRSLTIAGPHAAVSITERAGPSAPDQGPEES